MDTQSKRNVDVCLDTDCKRKRSNLVWILIASGKSTKI